MSLLNKPFDQITFEDVENYCKEQHPETATLDYKQAVPKDLAKHVAAMSNTLGGFIIIGVAEDKNTGLPTKWEGISPAGKPVDRVHQFVANVKPYPGCSVRATNEKNGNIIILVLRGVHGYRPAVRLKHSVQVIPAPHRGHQVFARFAPNQPTASPRTRTPGTK